MAELAAWLAHTDAHLPPAAADGARDRAQLGGQLLAEQDRLRRLVHRLLGFTARAGDVDDLVQDVLLRAWQRRGSFRGEASVATWLTAIALRRVQQHVRWRQVRRCMLPFVDAPEAQPAVAVPCTVEHGDDVAAMQRAMARLRHADREVLVLHYLQALPIAEVAALLRCGKNALEQRLSRARTRLRAELEATP